jgi:DNA (cytosine-5)-methyltransferase 1
VIDLFAGCGGFTRGFHEFRPEGAPSQGSAFRTLVAVEHDRAAAATFAANFGSLQRASNGPGARVFVGDIETWTPEGEDLQAEVVIGGPPCQGFSALNRAKVGAAERNGLWREYVRIVQCVKPKLFVIENVDRFLKSEEYAYLLTEVQPGGSLDDYRLIDPLNIESDDSPAQRAGRYLLNSADYGSVQARRRAIVMGVRKDIEGGAATRYPSPSHAKPSRPTWPESQTALFGDLAGASTLSPWLPVDSIFEESAKFRISGTSLPDGYVKFSEADCVVPGVFTTRDLHIGRTPVELSMARYRAIPAGGNRNDLRGKWYTTGPSGKIQILDAAGRASSTGPVEYLSTESWDNHNSGTGDVMGRLRLGSPSVTIRTEFFKPEKGRYLHPVEHRPITHFEAARIQGFPADFRWCGTKQQIAKQIGNAVPVPLGRAIASAVYACLRGGAAVPLH